ncbi:polyprenyl synthetase family protein [Piscinibacterium candidicorallinum]|jgi:geranylgeranyl diphosphate synthase type II|uniref:Polyprenyl synthetase family protein n=1 Tax=Piscinibacterium candidicorallinum TaxID=1793872 RepID=A0ABV7H5R6_9BURK
MRSKALIEQALESAVTTSEAQGCPPRLAAAVRHAVFPGGARIRPQLCMAVSMACGNDDPRLTMAAAAAIELLHCASLVHDDLPCFDNAATRRGQPSVQAAYGERLAVLAGDALIVMAFQQFATSGAQHCERVAPVLGTVVQGVGMPTGIVAGQAWECEPRVSLAEYQRAKTGALFTAATRAGALAAGARAEPWAYLGDWLGEAYQVADDIRDVIADPKMLGKPIGQDATHGRPSAAAELGLGGAVEHFDRLVAQAIASIPPCAGAPQLRQLVQMESERLVPLSMTTTAGVVRRPVVLA